MIRNPAPTTLKEAVYTYELNILGSSAWCYLASHPDGSRCDLVRATPAFAPDCNPSLLPTAAQAPATTRAPATAQFQDTSHPHRVSERRASITSVATNAGLPQQSQQQLQVLHTVDVVELVAHKRPNAEHSWFPGFAWQHLSCKGCSSSGLNTGLGWLFTPTGKAGSGLRMPFFALLLTKLREREIQSLTMMQSSPRHINLLGSSNHTAQIAALAYSPGSSRAAVNAALGRVSMPPSLLPTMSEPGDGPVSLWRRRTRPTFQGSRRRMPSPTLSSEDDEDFLRGQREQLRSSSSRAAQRGAGRNQLPSTTSPRRLPKRPATPRATPEPIGRQQRHQQRRQSQPSAVSGSSQQQPAAGGGPRRPEAASGSQPQPRKWQPPR